MNTKLGTETKSGFQKGFFKLPSNVVFGKIMEKCQKAQRY